MTTPETTRTPDLTLTGYSIDPGALTAVCLRAAAGDDAPEVLAPGLPQLEDLRALAVTLGASGRADEVVRGAISVDGALAPVILLGLGEGDADSELELGLDELRRAAGALGRARPEAQRIALLVPALDAELAEAAATGYALGAYRFDAFKSGEERSAAAALSLAAPDADDALEPALERARAIAAAVELVRDLVNTPPNALGPAELAERAVAVAEAPGCDAKVWDEAALEAEGFGGHMGVGRGSVRPPRLVRIAYRPEGATGHVALVGKGITFDTGGLSLKPAASMINMKTDMAGAASILGVVQALSAIGAKINVTGWLCIAENMPSGVATRPDDVITIKGGTTVEVTNTDAEGRLVLADGLAAASADELPADAIIDIATLTGAQLIALGERTTGVMGNDEELRSRILDAAERAGEAAWPMPIPEEIFEPLRSDVADFANARPGNRNGGMLMAAAFLEKFVGADASGSPIPWAHLDIAGPAFNESKPFGVNPKGATGAMVRTLVELLEREAERA
ncbi:putative cytosol aminopeptidase [Pseudoclavibacter triregionum]|nr:putative cytosol aminopeptidase [Pseudoclavibacter triregionum]